MKPVSTILSGIREVNKYRLKTILFIAFFWTLIDTLVVFTLNRLPRNNSSIKPVLLREFILFLMSLIMGYLLVVALKKLFRNFYLWAAFLIKSLILLAAAFLMQLLLYAVNSVSILGMPVSSAFHSFYGAMFNINWLFQKISYWLILFIITQLIIEINEKYSPGVFIDIFFGKYVKPKIEKRIVTFIDLKNSTPIAEKLKNVQYFKFIREFIFHISEALIQYGGRIYQYVGDEIVVSWLYNKKNIKNCMKALLEAHKNFKKNSDNFKKHYGIVPEYRVGIHIGNVTVGEIGLIKKDLAMSGDTMNTTARIRDACSELNKNYIVSKDFIEHANLKESQIESLGLVKLKGKEDEIELFSLKV
jgi:adenylate cyclase